MAGTVIVKNGLEVNRPNVIPGVGEWIYATDSKRTYMGDGVTPGGVSVSRKHFEVATLADIQNLEYVSDGDTCDTEDTSDVFMYINGTWVNILSNTYPPIVWTEATLSTNWSNVGGNISPVRFAKQGRLVILEGGCKRPGGTDTICTLPVGHRPPYDIIKPVFGHSGLMRMDIMSTGEVVLQTNGKVDWVSFNVQFSVAE